MIRPEIITPLNPVGVDAAIREMQISLADLTLNDELVFEGGLLFGLIEGQREPKIMWKGEDFFSVAPDDNFPIMAFFYESDPRSQVSETYNEYNLNLVVWFNQNRFFPNVRHRVKEFIINRIQQDLDNETLKVYTHKDNIFKDFKLKNENFITDKFDAFRMSFKYQREFECINPTGETIENFPYTLPFTLA